MKKKQLKELIALGVLLVMWGISGWYFNRKPAITRSTASAKVAKAAQQESLIRTRFHKVRAEIDGLYHYRIKPLPFDSSVNLFRIPKGMEGLSGTRSVAKSTAPPKTAADATKTVVEQTEFGDTLLRHAIALARIGGVVTLNSTTQLTVNGGLHKEGEVFTTKVESRMVLIRIRLLSTSSVTLALDDPQDGDAEIKVRLK